MKTTPAIIALMLTLGCVAQAQDTSIISQQTQAQADLERYDNPGFYITHHGSN